MGLRSFFEMIREDFEVIFEKDPAARRWLEVITYPGFHAIVAHRFIHALHQAGIPVLPRWLNHLTRFATGIEIHPGAQIGRRFFIDHGMGVVIGETAEIGDDVLIYHGVTLGGTSSQPIKRHPTVGDHVIIGAGASLIGNITIGESARIGAGTVITKDVPPGATAVGAAPRIILSASSEVTGDSFSRPPRAEAETCSEEGR